MRLLSCLAIMSTTLCLGMKSEEPTSNTSARTRKVIAPLMQPLPGLNALRDNKSLFKKVKDYSIQQNEKLADLDRKDTSLLNFISGEEQNSAIESIIKHRANKLEDKNSSDFLSISDEEKEIALREVIRLREEKLIAEDTNFLELIEVEYREFARNSVFYLKQCKDVEHYLRYAEKACEHWLRIFEEASEDEKLLIKAWIKLGNYLTSHSSKLVFPMLEVARAREILDKNLPDQVILKNTAGPLSIEECFLYLIKAQTEIIKARREGIMKAQSEGRCNIINVMHGWFAKILTLEAEEESRSLEQAKDIFMLTHLSLKKPFYNLFFENNFRTEKGESMQIIDNELILMSTQPLLDKVLIGNKIFVEEIARGRFEDINARMNEEVYKPLRFLNVPKGASFRPYLVRAAEGNQKWFHRSLEATTESLSADIKKAKDCASESGEKKLAEEELTEKLGRVQESIKKLKYSLVPIIIEYLNAKELLNYRHAFNVKCIDYKEINAKLVASSTDTFYYPSKIVNTSS